MYLSKFDSLCHSAFILYSLGQIYASRIIIIPTMDIQYVDILTGENLFSIEVANMDLIH